METLKEFFLRAKFAGAEHEGTAKHKEREALKKTQQEKHKSGGGVHVLPSGIKNEETIAEVKIKLPKVDPNRTPQAHKGYSIDKNLVGQHYISKDGYHIGYAKDVDDAKKIIDQLTEAFPTQGHVTEPSGDVGREAKFVPSFALNKKNKKNQGGGADEILKMHEEIIDEKTYEYGRDYGKPRQTIKGKQFKEGDRVRHRKDKDLGTVKSAHGHNLYVHWDNGEKALHTSGEVVHSVTGGYNEETIREEEKIPITKWQYPSKKMGKEEKGTAKDKQQKSLNKAAQEGPAASGKLELQSMGVYNEEFKAGDKIRTKIGGQIPGVVTKVEGDYVHFNHATDKRPKGLFGKDTEPKTYRVHKSNVVKEETENTETCPTCNGKGFNMSRGTKVECVRCAGTGKIKTGGLHKGDPFKGFEEYIVIDEAKKKKYVKQDDHNASVPVEMSGMRDGVNIGESTLKFGEYIREASDTTSVPASDNRGDALSKDNNDLARTVLKPKKAAKHPQIEMETKALKDNLTQGYQSGIGTLRSESFQEFISEEDRLKSAADDLKKAEAEHYAARNTHQALNYASGPNHRHTKDAHVKANLARNKWQQAILNHKKLMDLDKFKKRLKSNKY